MMNRFFNRAILNGKLGLVGCSLSLQGASVGLLTLIATACGGALNEETTVPVPSNQVGQLPWKTSGLGQVTDAYGLARVQEGAYYAESKVKPWSSYWFPARDTSLFEPVGTDPAPLQKYDTWARKAKKIKADKSNYKAAEYEKEIIFVNPASDSWAGLCNAWAKASIMEPEPRKTIELEGVKFTSFDQKALLIKSYENTQGFRYFGERFQGKRGDNPDDILPDQFHRFMQAELFDKGNPFIMDRDPGIQVWNMPVYKAEVTITKDSSDSRVMHVHTTLGWAGPRNELDFQGTWTVSADYFYDLYGVALPDGTFQVHSGVWTGASLENHPDFVTAIPDKRPSHYSDNPEIVNELVDEVLGKARAQALELFNFF